MIACTVHQAECARGATRVACGGGRAASDALLSAPPRPSAVLYWAPTPVRRAETARATPRRARRGDAKRRREAAPPRAGPRRPEPLSRRGPRVAAHCTPRSPRGAHWTSCSRCATKLVSCCSVSSCAPSGCAAERGGDGGATRRRGEIANGPSREGDGGARGNNGDATDDANRGTDDGGERRGGRQRRRG